MKRSAKNRSEKCDQNPPKKRVKDKTPVKLQAWHFTFKTSLYQ